MCRPIEANSKQRPTWEARRTKAPAQEKSWTRHTQDEVANAWTNFKDEEQDGDIVADCLEEDGFEGDDYEIVTIEDAQTGELRRAGISGERDKRTVETQGEQVVVSQGEIGKKTEGRARGKVDQY